MHPHAELLQKLFRAVDGHDARAIADCYHANATFRDIAFHLHGKKKIHDMWRMICSGDIRATFEIVHAGDGSGHVKVVDEYTFTDTGRKVRNVIDSRFLFADDLVVEHRDECDPRAWAAMAIGGLGGFLAGRVGALRRWKASRKLRNFVKANPDCTSFDVAVVRDAAAASARMERPAPIGFDTSASRQLGANHGRQV